MGHGDWWTWTRGDGSPYYIYVPRAATQEFFINPLLIHTPLQNTTNPAQILLKTTAFKQAVTMIYSANELQEPEQMAPCPRAGHRDRCGLHV